ncbi:MAG TPA: arginine repressor [Polyangia bacterium]|nr:arginine repressor [Polyangia bacterium]
MISTDARRDAIREILARHPVSTQEGLRRHLAARGIRAAQATLSRDMVALGVQRSARPGGARYVVEGDGGLLPIDPVRRLVDSVKTNGALVVVRTKASAAPTVARALDEAALGDVLGTLAGDDTVFVAPANPRGGRALAHQLRRLLGQPRRAPAVSDSSTRRG